MRIQIYQIRDAEKKKEAMAALMDRPPLSAPKEVDESLYHRVFMGDIDCESPYDILFRMNIDGHRLFRGERMGLTDVVEMEMDSGRISLLYDSYGVSAVSFDPEKAQKDDSLIRVLVIEPRRVPYESEIENTLEGQEGAVEGMMRRIHNEDGTITGINVDCKFNGMEGNRRFMGDVLVGPVFIAGNTGADLCSLTDEQMAHYMELFFEPEEISAEEIKKYCAWGFYHL